LVQELRHVAEEYRMRYPGTSWREIVDALRDVIAWATRL
jgi:uncharacterized protein with HEPN domain